MDLIAKTIGKRISSRRRLAGISQARLAETIGVAPETISRIETGALIPSLERLVSVAAELDIELDDLFRLRSADGPKERALEKLLWVVARRTVADIDLVTTLAAAVFDHAGKARGPRAVSEP
jgi:transcriptional regulator with XRE-family HTH domain